MIILQLLTFDFFYSYELNIQDDIMLIVLWQGGTQNTLEASSQVNVTVILTLKFCFTNHVY